MSQLSTLLVSGVAVGTIYGLVALGFVLVFKSAGAINFAHGEFLMVGAYVALTAAVTYGASLATTAVVTVLAVGLLGVLVYLLAVRRLIGASAFVIILVTIGVAQVVRAGVLIAYGPLERRSVDLLPSGGFFLGGASVSWTDVITFTLGILFTVGFFYFFRRTGLGLKMRSVAENLEASLVVGLRPDRIFLLAWLIAGIAAGIAGFLYSNRTPVISLGIAGIGLRAFPAAMLGGIESVEGAMIAGILIGIFEQLAAGYLGGEWRDVVAFSLMFVVLLVRPFGLFGRPHAARI